MKNAWERIKLATPGGTIGGVKKTVAAAAKKNGVQLLTNEEIYTLLHGKNIDFNRALSAIAEQLPEELPDTVKKDYAKIKITEVAA